jgi:hypothetical protein
MRRTVLVAALAALAAAPLPAQTAHPDPVVEPGMRVRVRAAPIEWIPVSGRLVTLDADSLLVHIPRRPRSLAIAMSDVHSVELSAGHARAPWTLLGAATGAAAGVAVSHALLEDARGNVGLPATTEGIATTIGSMLGGAVVGWLVAPERWRPARLPEP